MNPRLLQIVSLFFIGYGIIDIIFVNALLGIVLLLIGIGMFAFGYRRRQRK